MCQTIFRSLLCVAVLVLLLIGRVAPAAASAGTIFVTDENGAPRGEPFGTGRVLAFDAATGQYLRTVMTGLTVPAAVTIGPNGLLYVTDSGTGQVISMSPSTVNATPGGPGTSVFASNIFLPEVCSTIGRRIPCLSAN